ncbi:RagB/SusD family nutrient uptake outer membrane protein [Mucilaginibacter sp. KACC 22773]|uniref:RagB/SusD family nutrient uptake outer membrane protein n=1 Tax=Mucilaginibacter sp. KACC 22773 TaxID=3025671 RepID=UPI0023671D37|nr:RagB/SusD family nutrient uptake outer membrane protein [Mucilaginibacter sp. KACC 22773]WDF77165.1 RagB/SusD family nutrient uptake outer membrane protein [Mucilaginibacter sp. KACC 22773]
MKRFSYIILTLLFICSTPSCKKDFLDLKPLDKYSDEAVWTDPALVQTFVNNIYNGVPYPFTAVMLSSTVDESMAVWDWETSNVTNSLVTPSYLSIWDPNFWVPSIHEKSMSWQPTYKNIRACNLFLEKIDAVNFDDQNRKDQLKGEVMFLRAYFYHQLVSLYGGVPLITKAYSLNDDFEAPRDSYEKCIDFIGSECDKAAALLPVSGDKARATKGAVLALKARVLLYAASDLYNSNGAWAASYSNKELIGYVGGNREARWTAAKNAAKAVMDLGVYHLYKENPATSTEAAKNYGDLFLNNGNEEDIYLQYYDNLHNSQWDSPSPGLFNGPNGWHNWGGNTPIGQFVDSYEMKDGTKFSWSNPTEAADPYKDRDPRFYASILYDGAVWRQRPADVRNADPVGIVQVGTYKKADGSTFNGLDTRKGPVEDWNGTYTGYYLRKFIDPSIDHQYVKQQLPWRRFRYAEVLLNYAEACIALGQESEARQYINLIRKRAGMPAINDAGSALTERYRNERRIELAYEEQRFFDVRRWMIPAGAYAAASGVEIKGDMAANGTISNRTYAVKTVQARNWLPRFYLLPIQIDELNRNSKLIQNPLY